MDDGDGDYRFETVDWSEIDRSSRPLTAERAVALTGLLLVAGAWLYHTTVAGIRVGTWGPAPIEWAFALAVVVVLAYGVVPAARNVSSLRRVLGRLRGRPVTALAGASLLGLVGFGLVGPLVLSRPTLNFGFAYQPPVGFSTDLLSAQCAGQVTGDAFDTVCHGSLAYPLGTDGNGVPMSFLLASGARATVYVLAITAAFVVPLATAVGLVAGFRGGRLDDLLMAYVDIQVCLPALFLYFVGYIYAGPSLLLLVVSFGVLSWGGVARLVRSETLTRREDGHVLVARSLGASWRYVARRHVLPNITNTLVPAAAHLLALFVIVEAGVAFLGFHDVQTYSWGGIISESITTAVDSQLVPRSEEPAYRIWWVSTLPALALTGTLLSLKLVGDGLRDALDPRGE